MARDDLLSSASEIAAAVEFLDRWYGEAPRQLVSIVPDGAIASKCLWLQNPDGTKDWLRKQVAAGKNVYFHVNQPGWALDKRAEKKDIRQVRALHVDIDPKGDESPEDCKARVLPLLEKHEPPPSVVIDSGGGVQAFWLLDEMVQLDGTPEAWERMEAYNIAIQQQYDADSCFNVDRIMRCPGTINLPNKKKKSKGRVPVPAVVFEEMTNWAKHSLSAFTPALKPSLKASTAAGRGTVEISANLPRYSSTDDLPVKLLDYTVMLIVNGLDPENPTKYRSRSEALWRVVCDMVRANADDDTIAAIILDRGFKISAHVLDQRNPEAYAARQIAEAREEVIDPALRELNSRHAVIENDRGGRCVVAEEDWDDVMGRWHIKYQSFDAFRNRYMHRPVEVGRDKDKNPIYMPMGKWWLHQEHRRQYRKIVFRPCGAARPNEFNLWRGFSCEAQPGDGHVGFLEFLRVVVCDSDEVRYRFLLGWMARAVQRPDAPGEVAVVMRGKKGTGKSFTATTFGKLFGQHFAHVTSPRLVAGDFNGHLRDCVVLFADEAFHAGDKKHESILKGLVTESTIAIEAKYADAEFIPNTLHIMMASNDTWVVPASGDERRFCVLDLNEERIRDAEYFGGLKRQLESGGYSNLLSFLKNYDLSRFEVRNVPSTPGLEAQKIESLPPEAQAVLQVLIDGELPNNPTDSPDVAAMRDQAGSHGASNLLGLLSAARISVPAMRNVNESRLAKALKSVGCVSARLHHYGNRHGWRFPPLREARAAFDKRYGHYDWPDPDAEWRQAGAPPLPF